MAKPTAVPGTAALIRVRKRGQTAPKCLRLAFPRFVGGANHTRRDQRLLWGPHIPFAGFLLRPSSRYRIRQPASRHTHNTRRCSGSTAGMRFACLCNRPQLSRAPVILPVPKRRAFALPTASTSPQPRRFRTQLWQASAASKMLPTCHAREGTNAGRTSTWVALSLTRRPPTVARISTCAAVARPKLALSAFLVLGELATGTSSNTAQLALDRIPGLPPARLVKADRW